MDENKMNNSELIEVNIDFFDPGLAIVLTALEELKKILVKQNIQVKPIINKMIEEIENLDEINQWITMVEDLKKEKNNIFNDLLTITDQEIKYDAFELFLNSLIISESLIPNGKLYELTSYLDKNPTDDIVGDVRNSLIKTIKENLLKIDKYINENEIDVNQDFKKILKIAISDDSIEDIWEANIYLTNFLINSKDFNFKDLKNKYFISFELLIENSTWSLIYDFWIQELIEDFDQDKNIEIN